MRRQELIYAQNDGFARNKDLLNVSTSTDICLFESPLFDMSGATKLVSGMTSGNTGIHLIQDGNEEIDFIFNFNDNLTSLMSDTVFSYNVYKYDDASSVFKEPPVISSDGTSYFTFSGTNFLYSTIPVTGMMDGEYIIKGKYDYKICTYILSQLGLRNSTNSYTVDGEYHLYNSEYDYYFAAIYEARTPIFDLTPGASDRPLGSLNSITILPSGETSFTIDSGINGSPVVTLNGMVLAKLEDYDLSGNTINLFGPTLNDDIITIIFVGAGSQNGLVANSYTINSPIISGMSDYQGENTVYYNASTKKYEIFTEADPITSNDVIISINGAILANNVDYYQSITNKRRFILEGNLVFGDVITIIYNAHPSYVGSVTDSSINIYWTIDIAPQKVNGRFITQLSYMKDFSTISASATTPYIVSNRVYNTFLNINGVFGDKMYYRVINEKKFITILGETIESITTSETIPIIIQSNSLNSY